MNNRMDKWKEKRATIEKQELEIKPIPEQLNEVFGVKKANYITENQRDLIALELAKDFMHKTEFDYKNYKDYITHFIVAFKNFRKDEEDYSKDEKDEIYNEIIQNIKE